MTRRRGAIVAVGLGLVLAIGGAVIVHFFPPESHAFYPRCALHVWTGLHCPGCGSLRAVSALTRGEVLEALSSNLLLTVALPAMAGMFALRRWRHGDWALASWVPAWGWWLGLALVIGFGLLRNLPGTPFSWLHP